MEHVSGSLADELVLLRGFTFVMRLFGDVANVYLNVGLLR